MLLIRSRIPSLQLSRDVQNVAAVAKHMSEKAVAVSDTGDQVHTLADDLLAAIGVFRLHSHRRAREAIEVVAAQPGMRGLRPRDTLTVLRQALAAHAFFELLYVTDVNGRQITANVAAEDFRASYGGNGCGADWSSREWFRRARDDGRTYVTPAYRSAATGQFCFTVATPVRDGAGCTVAVLGADVRLAALL